MVEMDIVTVSTPIEIFTTIGTLSTFGTRAFFIKQAVFRVTPNQDYYLAA